ncbi:MAG: hypothetical protein EAZ21_10380 [Betaproteobacteria bacterium]|nr:MAG: hypothetical protein EAZ21_10380 [Betaproteobacteria bacterium]
MRILGVLYVLLCAGLLPVRYAQAMQLARAGDALVLSGEIVYQDLARVRDALDRAPQIQVIVLRNSMGGNSWTGYRLGELFRERGLTTVVSGHCVSSCSRLFLGGRERRFASDYPAAMTYVGFHGHYDFGKLNTESVAKHDLVQWTLRFAGKGLDRALVERWAAIPTRAGDVRFYPDAARSQYGVTTFYCVGSESRRPQRCERLATDALSQGIITSPAMYQSADRDQLRFGTRERQWPSTGYATLAEPPKGVSAPIARDYRQFLEAAFPRGFAISEDRRFAAWRGNNRAANEEAIAACERSSRQRCRLYAVDDRVVFSAPPSAQKLR